MGELLSQDELNTLLGGGDLASADMSAEQTAVMTEVATLFTNAQTSVFGMLSGKEVSISDVSRDVMTQAEFRGKFSDKPFVFRAVFGGFNDVPMAFVTDARGMLTLADLMMGNEGTDLPAEPNELYLNAAQEGISQVVGSAFTKLSGMLGGKRLMPGGVTAVTEAEDGWLPFTKLDEDAKLWCVMEHVKMGELELFNAAVAIPLDGAVAMADAANETLKEKEAAEQAKAQPQAEAAGAAAGAAAAAGGQGQGAQAGRAPTAPGHQKTGPAVDVHPAEFTPLTPASVAGGDYSKIDLIADIPVRVTVELGKARKNISEILSMTTGSVIELDKMAGEAVDVLVNGKLIAKGEVVVIDENFGVRITEILNTAAKAYAM
ncbi:MAG: flagellar motor switch protein FliN [Synergistaceae bacterium]|jgi:flagellar motor switch protein FliN/FliY|nr:flagellar motor switch protein FliN [Synergistaceae bacterium]